MCGPTRTRETQRCSLPRSCRQEQRGHPTGCGGAWGAGGHRGGRRGCLPEAQQLWAHRRTTHVAENWTKCRFLGTAVQTNSRGAMECRERGPGFPAAAPGLLQPLGFHVPHHYPQEGTANPARDPGRLEGARAAGGKGNREPVGSSRRCCHSLHPSCAPASAPEKQRQSSCQHTGLAGVVFVAAPVGARVHEAGAQLPPGQHGRGLLVAGATQMSPR